MSSKAPSTPTASQKSTAKKDSDAAVVASPQTRTGRAVKTPKRYTVSGEPTPEEKERRERREEAARTALALQRAQVKKLKAQRALLMRAKKAAQAEAKAARALVREGKKQASTAGSSKRKTSTKSAARKRTRKQEKAEEEEEEAEAEAATPLFDPVKVRALATAHPDRWWKHPEGASSLQEIGKSSPLSRDRCLRQEGAVCGLRFSEDGRLMASASTAGTLKIWDVEDDWKELRTLRDLKEAQLDEFYCLRFTPDARYLFAAGKLKDRQSWSDADDDNSCLPSPIKLFDVSNGEVVLRLDEGHTEEVLALKMVKFRGKNYLLSGSQDGYIWRWELSDDFRTLVEKTRIQDQSSYYVCTISFLPNCGNKYFVAGCDEALKIYDFERAKILQTFPDVYTSFLDCVKVLPVPLGQTNSVLLVTRGVELLREEDSTQLFRPNTCNLHKLTYPQKIGDEFRFETLKSFSHRDYIANTWLMRLATNGKYILAPSSFGRIFVWEIESGSLVAVLKEHEDCEIRDVIFHPSKPLIVSAGDDSNIIVYSDAEAQQHSA